MDYTTFTKNQGDDNNNKGGEDVEGERSVRKVWREGDREKKGK